ncbi:MAG: type II toxin-antitoxin system VapC family toxin [Sporichthyaceae bacterium]
MSVRFAFDTAIFIYARGTEHPYRQPCRDLVEAARTGLIRGEGSVEVVQEYAHILIRRGVDRATVRDDARDVAALFRNHEFGEADLAKALALVAEHPELGMRDAVHAATAVRRDVPFIVSPDRGFDAVPGLERLDPVGALDRLIA